jgi:urea transport system substrate-binding protein
MAISFSLKKIPIPFCIIIFCVALAACSGMEDEPIKVGILHSQTGTLAPSEVPVANSALMAIAEINASGGVLGRKIEPIIVDTRSDSSTAAVEAERLIIEEGVVAVFGCWTSACRKAVKPVVEENDSLLIYPVQYEGLEESANIIYTGSTPNQQIIPAIEWAYVNLGKRFFLVGSDYIFPRAANEIIKEKVERLGGEIVGEEYLILGSTDTDDLIQKIKNAQPDVILNTINGDSNTAFFQALRETGITVDDIPTLSFSIAESELQGMNNDDIAGDYAAWNYFQSIDSPANRDFVNNYHSFYGVDRVTADPVEAGYIGVYLWVDAVEDGQSTDASSVVREIADNTMSAPQGFVRVDTENQHLWKTVRVGQIKADGQFEIVWDPGVLIPPRPFPKTRPLAEWETFLEDMYNSWGGNWENLAE